MPTEKSDLQKQEDGTTGGLQLDPEMEDNRHAAISSEPNKENTQTQPGAGTALNDNKANSSSVRSNN